MKLLKAVYPVKGFHSQFRIMVRIWFLSQHHFHHQGKNLIFFPSITFIIMVRIRLFFWHHFHHGKNSTLIFSQHHFHRHDKISTFFSQHHFRYRCLNHENYRQHLSVFRLVTTTGYTNHYRMVHYHSYCWICHTESSQLVLTKITHQRTQSPRLSNNNYKL